MPCVDRLIRRQLWGLFFLRGFIPGLHHLIPVMTEPLVLGWNGCNPESLINFIIFIIQLIIIFVIFIIFIIHNNPGNNIHNSNLIVSSATWMWFASPIYMQVHCKSCLNYWLPWTNFKEQLNHSSTNNYKTTFPCNMTRSLPKYNTPENPNTPDFSNTPE